MFIKRDDYTGSELSGNKVRKLEFLLAAALAGGCDCVVTVGSVQSNHCRATAAAARRVGLEPHLVLRGEDQGLVGNLMIDKLMGATLHFGKDYETVVEELRQTRKPYAFPSGGSSALGTWGYVHAVTEIDEGYDRIYFACGSGGTAAGLALGVSSKFSNTELVGLCVDDDPDFFYDKLDGLYKELGGDVSSRGLLRLEPCIGAGYGIATDEELRFIIDTARTTGVVLDPVYTGKAARGMMNDLAASPVAKALFIHTGGHLGLFAKTPQLASILTADG